MYACILAHTHMHTHTHTHTHTHAHTHTHIAQSAGAVEYTDSFSAMRECPVYDTKQSVGDVPAMLELWGMRNTPSLPSLSCPLWPGVVAPDWALSMG